ncbi:integrase, catalytic region, zinc finger, CCHC-type containing protein [Tanacetum coccineum]
MVVQIVLWIVDSGCSKHMTGLGHNLFSVGQFCDGDLEVAFCSKTCYVRNLEGDDLLTSGRESNLYTISISDMAASSPVCLMSKATLTKSWLWHRRLSHLNFGTINDLTRLDLVDGLPKFKYGKDHLCSACERGKSKKASHPLKLVPSDHSKLELLHMDLCGPMRVALINGKKYILELLPMVTTSDEQTSPISLTELMELIQVWELVPRPEEKNIIALKWLWKNKYDAENIVVRNKTRLVQKIQQKKGIDFRESSAPVARLEASDCVSISTPMATERLDTDLQDTLTDQTTYRHMIGGLMYLTASRPDIAFATFVCARYQARPTVKHLKEVKWIFRYLRQSYNMGLWYPKDSGFELIAYSDADHAGCKDDCKSTSGGLQFLGGKLVS